MQAHDAYQWLRARMPRLMDLMPAGDPITQFQFVQDLTQHITLLAAARPRKATRDDKRRRQLKKDIDSVLQRLLGGAVTLTPEALDALLHLLDAARRELAQRKPPRSIRFPALRNFAQQFLWRHLVPYPDFILEAARAAGLPCDQRTARRYLKQMRTSAAERDR